MNVNLHGMFSITQMVSAHMKNRGSGKIINMASIAGESGGTVAGAHYAASKAGVLILNKIFAQALAPYGITVNAISPAAIDSPITKEVMDGDKIKEVIQKIPLKKMGTMQEVAAAVSYLTSDNANFITGSVLDINGGLYMR